MGLGSDKQITYLSIVDGKIAQRFKTKVEGSTERTTSKGKVVYEKYYKTLSGKITNINKRESDWGTDWQVFLEDGQEEFCLSFPYSSRYANGFMCAVKNLALERPVTFSPWMKEIDGKKKTNLYLQQDGKKVDWFFTKENPNGLPPMVKTKVKGKDVWDDSDRLEFFENMINSEIKPLLGINLKKGETLAKPSATSLQDEDDLPF